MSKSKPTQERSEKPLEKSHQPRSAAEQQSSQVPQRTQREGAQLTRESRFVNCKAFRCGSSSQSKAAVWFTNIAGTNQRALGCP